MEGPCFLQDVARIWILPSLAWASIRMVLSSRVGLRTACNLRLFSKVILLRKLTLPLKSGSWGGGWLLSFQGIYYLVFGGVICHVLKVWTSKNALQDKTVIIWDVKNEQVDKNAPSQSYLTCRIAPRDKFSMLCQATVATLSGHESAVQAVSCWFFFSGHQWN